MGYSELHITCQLVRLSLFDCTTARNELLSVSVMGKAEGHGTNWHGHVTALTVAPCYRRLGIAALLMNWLEDVSEK